MCPEGHLWIGAHCVTVTADRESQSFLAAVGEALRPLFTTLNRLFGK
jgi:hypothetical protein